MRRGGGKDFLGWMKFKLSWIDWEDFLRKSEEEMREKEEEGLGVLGISKGIMRRFGIFLGFKIRNLESLE